jgi:hypothetical protein
VNSLRWASLRSFKRKTSQAVFSEPTHSSTSSWTFTVTSLIYIWLFSSSVIAFLIFKMKNLDFWKLLLLWYDSAFKRKKPPFSILPQVSPQIMSRSYAFFCMSSPYCTTWKYRIWLSHSVKDPCYLRLLLRRYFSMSLRGVAIANQFSLFSS